jgi:hypothetical protein
MFHRSSTNQLFSDDAVLMPSVVAPLNNALVPFGLSHGIERSGRQICVDLLVGLRCHGGLILKMTLPCRSDADGGGGGSSSSSGTSVARSVRSDDGFPLLRRRRQPIDRNAQAAVGSEGRRRPPSPQDCSDKNCH